MSNKQMQRAIALAVTAGAMGVMSTIGVGSVEAAETIELEVQSLTTETEGNISKKHVEKLVPELKKTKVNVAKLSKQIQLVNDTKGMELNADFQRQADGKYNVVLTAKKEKEQSFFLSGNNTGNNYSGNWRLGATYLHRNLTKNADSLGLAYVTSPGHWDDVKQAAVVYRAILPKAGDSMYVAYSWSDVDLGTIGNFGGMGVEATGRGQSAGLHYQHNFKYSSAKKQILDIGVDQKWYNNATHYSYSGGKINDQLNYDVMTASVSYMDITRKGNTFFAWNLGYTGNINSDDNFRLNRANSSSHFNLWKTGINYQARTKGDVIFGARVNGQYTGDNVITTEQFGAGGMNTVRGFKERTAYADKGVMGTMEIYSPEIGKGSRFVLFTDYAKLFNNEARVGELDSDDIGSYGIGYRFYSKKIGLSINLDYAHAYTNLKGISNNLRPWHLSISKEF